jgi:hypothetical protein
MNVPKVISPKTTEQQTVIARLEMRGSAKAKNIRDLRALKLQGEHNINDKDSRIAMVLAEQDIPSTDDVDAKIAAEYLQWEAIEEAKQAQKPKLAAAKREAADSILDGLKKEHDVLVHTIVSSLADVVAPAWAELFDLSRQLKDKDIGWRKGICETMPLDLFGPPNVYSPLAVFMRAAVEAGFLKSLPKEYR